MLSDTLILRFVALLFALWLLFAAGIYVAEQRSPEPVLGSFGEALYWGVAAFSTAGIADTPTAGLARLIGGIWIITGSVIFFGTIVAGVTGFFMRPLQRPVHRLVETIEYNLERLQDLSVEELDLLRTTTNTLILHMERLKERQQDSDTPESGQAPRGPTDAHD
jgi:voltage-gated potassium channel